MSGIMNMLVAAKTAIAAAVDAYFNRVTLLLPGNGTNGAQNNTFLDSSSNNFTITRNGNTTQGTFTPFSQTGWSNYLAGNIGFLLGGQSDFAFGTNDFKIEFFVYQTDTTNIATIYDSRPASTNGLYVTLYVNTNRTVDFYTNSSVRITSTNTLTLNAWNHVCLSRVSGVTRMFINGVTQSTTYTDTNSYLNGASAPAICISGFTRNSLHLIGYISNLSVLNGTGVTSVTVPTAPISPSTTNQKLLMFAENRFIDSNTAVTAKTFTTSAPTNQPSVQAFSPFAPAAAYSTTTVGGSGYFDGTGDYLSFPTSQAALLPGSGAFTYEIWCYQTVSTSNATLFSYGNATGNLRFFVANSTSVTLWNGSTNLVNQSTTNPLNAWQHFVVQRDGSNVVSIYQNGSRIYNATVSSTFNAGTLAIGFDAGGTAWNGYISGFKATIGSAVYSGTTISVPTAPPSPTGSTACVLFTNAGITDATAKNDLETVGNAQISTAQSKFGGSSMSFNGTSDYLTIAATQNFNIGTGDFTLEAWIYPSSFSSTRALFSFGNNNVFYFNTSGIPYYGIFGVSDTAFGSTAVSTNTWTYVAFVRSGSTITCYINGSSTGTITGTTATTAIGNGTALNYVGFHRGGNYFSGYIDDLRITKGYARTISTPTVAFPLQ